MAKKQVSSTPGTCPKCGRKLAMVWNPKMFIKEIELTNYRIFANASIKFQREENKNIYLIQGKSGTGKTTIVDAVRWCLFGDKYIWQCNARNLPLCNCKGGGLYDGAAGRFIDSED